MDFRTVIVLLAEHIYGAKQPTTIRCGRDWYIWLRCSIQAHAKSLGYLPTMTERGNILFHDAEIVRDDNLLISEITVEPVYIPSPVRNPYALRSS